MPGRFHVPRGAGRTRRGVLPIFERAAQRALRRGTLIVAGAGNESSRPGRIEPVGHPANCPSILAVAALTCRAQRPWFGDGKRADWLACKSRVYFARRPISAIGGHAWFMALIKAQRG